MRADSDFDASALQPGKPLLRNSQLGRWAAPKQVRRRCGHYQEIRLKRIQPAFYLSDAELFELGIDQEWLMTGFANLIETEEKFERIMGFLAAKVNRAAELPGRIHQRKFHEAAPGT